MKIGLLTFHQAYNIGAILQAYALQKTISDFGVESEFVDLPAVKKVSSRDIITANMKNADAFVSKVNKRFDERNVLFNDFKKRYFKVSKPYSNYDELDNDYDKFIVGSDQVWNFSIPDTNDRYFLPFTSKNKKYSYAASFGGNPIPEEKKQFVSESLLDFNMISVRENSGKDIVKTLTGKDSVLCVDPTFLLSKEEWKELTSPIDEKYVFVYMVQYSDILMKKAKEYATQHDLKLIVMNSTFDVRCGFDAFSKYGIKDFLSLICYADKVFTNSFHGTAFSLILDKPFDVVSLKSNIKDRNSRIVELLENSNKLDEIIIESKEYLKEILRG